MGLDICAALCGVTRDVTRAAVKRSINDENTILCETDNAKVLERTRCLPAKETGDGRTEFSEPEVSESSRCASAIQHCSLSLAKKREQFHCSTVERNFAAKQCNATKCSGNRIRSVPYERQAVHRSENIRNSLGSNYKSAALAVELRAQNEQRHTNEFPDKEKGTGAAQQKRLTAQ